jgi:hypothetical protein
MDCDTLIKIKSDVVDVEYMFQNKKYKKTLTVDQFIETFAPLYGKQKTPVLPPNCRQANIADDKATLLIEVPPHSQKIHVINRSTGNILFNDVIPLPNLLFVLTLSADNRMSQYSGISMSVYATHNMISNAIPTLYQCPLLNTGEGGSVCLGSTTIPPIGSLSQSGIYVNSYLTSRFNGDIVPKIEGVNSSLDGFVEFYKSIVGLSSFPINRLARSRSIITI